MRIFVYIHSFGRSMTSAWTCYDWSGNSWHYHLEDFQMSVSQAIHWLQPSLNISLQPSRWVPMSKIRMALDEAGRFTSAAEVHDFSSPWIREMREGLFEWCSVSAASMWWQRIVVGARG
jgi:hypothetical protein